MLDTESDVGFQMMRVNSLCSLIDKIKGHLRERSAGGVEGTVCLACKDDGEGGDDRPAERGCRGLERNGPVKQSS